jgi:hypothetical protein
MKKSALIFIMLSVVSAGASAAELRRLFYTPQQRAQLERQQVTGESDEGGKHNFIVVNGVIQKQDGNRIVWINGTQQPTTYGNEKAPSTESITVPGMSKPVQVKVGQRLILDTPAPVKADEIKSDKPDPVNPAAKEDD